MEVRHFPQGNPCLATSVQAKLYKLESLLIEVDPTIASFSVFKLKNTTVLARIFVGHIFCYITVIDVRYDLQGHNWELLPSNLYQLFKDLETPLFSDMSYMEPYSAIFANTEQGQFNFQNTKNYLQNKEQINLQNKQFFPEHTEQDNYDFQNIAPRIPQYTPQYDTHLTLCFEAQGQK